MTFRVQINGVVAWQRDVGQGAWQAGSADLSAFLNQTVAVRFVTNVGPANDVPFSWGEWSALSLAVSAKSVTADVTLAVPASVGASSIAVGGGDVNISGGTASISGLPLNSTAVVFVTPVES